MFYILLMIQSAIGWNSLGSGRLGIMTDPWYLEELDQFPSDLAQGTPATEDVERIIDELASVAAPGVGYSGTLSGGSFLPLDHGALSSGIGVSRTTALLIEQGHGLIESPALLRLERLGPAALTSILAHLDDRRETGLVFSPEQRHGALWFERRVSGNPLNGHESASLGSAMFIRSLLSPNGDHGLAYRLTVGDLCFVALGQIVNRAHYAAVQYQPSGNVVITSPTSDPQLAGMLRNVWSSEDPRRALLSSLLLDFHTRGSGSSSIQCGAAVRLAYYFPREASSFLIRRLEGLHTGTKDAEFYDGVAAGALVEALHFVTDPQIAGAVTRAMNRSEPVSVGEFLGVDLSDQQESWLRDELDSLVGAGPDRRPAVRRLLRAAWKSGPKEATRTLVHAMRSGDVVLCAEACRTLAWAPGDRRMFLVELGSLLEDRRRTGTNYAGSSDTPWLSDVLIAGQSGPRAGIAGPVVRSTESADVSQRAISRRILELYQREATSAGREPEYEPLFQGRRHALRVCDEAALALACIEPEFQFALRGNHRALDAQIRVIAAALEELLRR
jgi:hypothetical protein